MFIGHFAVGFASKRFAPRTNLAVLISAAVLLDIFWQIFVLTGFEHVRIEPGNTQFTPLNLVYFPWSHSLLMSFIWAIIGAAAYFRVTRYWPGTIAIGLLVVSHWLLDWITHGPDMSLYPHGARFGLGLWNSIAGTMFVEISMLAVGVALYRWTCRARDKFGHLALPIYVALLLIAYISDRFGTEPVNIAQIVWPGLVLEAILIPCAWWLDRHQQLRVDEQ